MIIAIPEQETVRCSGLGVPEHESVLSWYRWWCSECRVLASGARASHASSALSQADRHLAVDQCHVVGQLALIA